jgi:hypothetical protein
LLNSFSPNSNLFFHWSTPKKYCGTGALGFISLACVPISVVNTENVGVTP